MANVPHPTPPRPQPPKPALAPADAGAVTGEPMTGAASIVRSLEAVGVETVFGIPGGAVLPVYDPLFDSSVRHILVRHEQGAGHAAAGYAASTGKVGVCMATSGPGATNLVTPLADAHMDSVPMVAITGQVAEPLIGTDAFQEADIVGITMPITKHSFLITDPAEIPARIAEAFHIASTGRPGPVLVDIAKSAMQAQTTFTWPPAHLDIPGYRPITKPHIKQIKEAARLLATARRPVLYVGGGAIRAKASEDLLNLTNLSGAPVVTTLMARGALPDSHPQHLGMPGMHGTVAAVAALQKADLVVALGTRFDDRVTGRLDSFAPGATVVHADIDPAEISKNRFADVPIVGDLKDVLADLIAELEREQAHHGKPDLEGWWSTLDHLRETYSLGWTPTEDGLLAPQHVISRIGEISGPDSIYVAGVGQHQMWAAQFIRYQKPRNWLNSGGLGTMGYSVPAAMGAKVARPDDTVWAIDGDGCFQMTNQELATCAIEGIPIKVAIINNSSLGMVRQWQTLFYDSRYSNTDLNTGHETVRIPDFVKLAEAYGCVGLRCDKVTDVDETIRQAEAINDRPVVVDFVVSRDAMVWPMVAAGVSNDDIQYARGISPAFERDE
ncbi:acetolactate synthase large subunit [Ruania halotolerans]|uniref:acetolactate synthase large subunit n=1 Tax=Ruania halotolerans TaxID=2897773 RepID=UPI001E3D3ECB|nr:acetolactate synthase large subunit [Ruania halotolerans]UFU07737.1 acetolactate synthase large subunit [Ruania halotolerans]